MNAERIIDYDRGVIINTHFTGMDVFMYVDAPGKYLTAHGSAVGEQVAKEAGFDIEKLSKEKLRLERRLQANQMIDKELADDKDMIEVDVETRNGFQLVSFGLGRHNVKDPEGNILNAHPMTKEVAERLFAAMAGDAVVTSDDSKSIKQVVAKK